MVKNKAIIVSFDLGLKGDYNNFYAWLDSNNALECGNSVGVFTRDFAKDNFKAILEEIKNEIASKVRIEPNDRVYVFMKDEKGSMKGRFLFGSRKRAPWEGFSVKPADDTEDVF